MNDEQAGGATSNTQEKDSAHHTQIHRALFGVLVSVLVSVPPPA
jgi:hypothetical protein